MPPTINCIISALRFFFQSTLDRVEVTAACRAAENALTSVSVLNIGSHLVNLPIGNCSRATSLVAQAFADPTSRVQLPLHRFPEESPGGTRPGWAIDGLRRKAE